MYICVTIFIQNVGVKLVENWQDKCFELPHKGEKDGPFGQVPNIPGTAWNHTHENGCTNTPSTGHHCDHRLRTTTTGRHTTFGNPETERHPRQSRHLTSDIRRWITFTHTSNHAASRELNKLSCHYYNFPLRLYNCWYPLFYPLPTFTIRAILRV